MKTGILLLILLPIGCFFYEEKKSTHNRDIIIAVALLRSMPSASPTTNSTACSSTVSFSCGPASAFSTLAGADTTGKCATSGCHTNASQQSGLDITDYNSAKGFTIPGNACASRIYAAITTGTMVGNSNGAINQAVYCWIAGGSNP